MMSLLYITLACCYFTSVIATSINQSLILDEGSSACTFVSSYITFGDFFSSDSTQVMGQASNHYWTVGFVTSGDCATTPTQKLMPKHKRMLEEPFYMMHSLVDPYKFTVGDSSYLGKNNTLGDVYQRTAWFYKITEEHISLYDEWQPYIESSANFTSYDFPDINNYLTDKQSKNAKQNDLKMFAVADMDATDPAKPTINRIINAIDQVDVYLHVGDFAYDIFDSNGYVGDNYFAMLSKPYSSKPYLITPGNHERQGGFRFLNYRFRMPGGNDDLLTRNNWYSLKIKDTYFVTINYDWFLHAKDNGMDLYEERNRLMSWLISDIKNAKDAKFKVFYSHRPTFCGVMEKDDCTWYFYYYKPIEDILMKYKFDLVLHAHIHAYSRMNNVFSYQVIDNLESKVNIGSNYKTPLYILSGHAGTDHDFVVDNDPSDSRIIGSKYVSGKDGNFLNIALTPDAIVGELRDSVDNAQQDYWIVTTQKRNGDPIDLDNNRIRFEYLFWIVLGLCAALVIGNIIACIIMVCVKSKKRNQSIDKQSLTKNWEPIINEALYDAKLEKIQVKDSADDTFNSK